MGFMEFVWFMAKMHSVTCSHAGKLFIYVQIQGMRALLYIIEHATSLALNICFPTKDPSIRRGWFSAE